MVATRVEELREGEVKVRRLTGDRAISTAGSSKVEVSVDGRMTDARRRCEGA